MTCAISTKYIGRAFAWFKFNDSLLSPDEELLSLHRKRDEYWESALSLVLQRNTAIFINTILASLTHCFDYLNRNSIHYLIKIFTLKGIQLLFGEKNCRKWFPLHKLERSSRRQSSECRHRQQRLSPWIVPTIAWIHLPQVAMAFCLSGAQNLWTSRFKSSLPMAEICFIKLILRPVDLPT